MDLPPLNAGSASLGYFWRRRAKGTRLARKTQRKIPRVVATTPHCEDLLESLCTWAIGMPWVIEKKVADKERVRLFVVDCSVLARHAPWFAVESIPEGEFADRGIFLILPRDLVQRGVEKGWAVGNEAIGAKRSVTAIASPTSEREFCTLQRVLAGTYETAFG